MSSYVYLNTELKGAHVSLHGSQDKKTAKVSFTRQVDKDDAVVRYNGILVSHKRR